MRSIRPAATPASKLLLQWSECISFFHKRLYQGKAPATGLELWG